MLKISGSNTYRKSKDGCVVAVQHKLQLEQAKDHFHHACRSEGKNLVHRMVINARGWELIRSIAGVQVIRPATIKNEEGVEVDNPIIKRSGHQIDFVRVRGVISGRGPNGNLVAIDLTLSYDVAGAMATEMLDMFMETPDCTWGTMLSRATAEEEMKKKPTCGKVDIAGGNCLLYDMTSRSVREIVRRHTEFAVSADRAAITILERNLSRRFFGFTECEQDGTVEFTSWQVSDKEWDKIEVSQETITIGSDTVSLDKHEETATDLEDESASVRANDLKSLIKREAKRVGGWGKARSMTRDLCASHNIKWGDIGTTDNQLALEAIYKFLSEVAIDGEKE